MILIIKQKLLKKILKLRQNGYQRKQARANYAQKFLDMRHVISNINMILHAHMHTAYRKSGKKELCEVRNKKRKSLPRWKELR